MTDLVLHHYDPSPYSEKIRLILGYKRLAWKSVQTPMIMPKPDLIALTGGYRRAPVMQIGADIYCDTACIAAELEHRFPEPTLFPRDASPWAMVVAAWADAYLFWKAAPYATGSRVDSLPAAFLKDRGAMRGTEMVPEQMKAAVPHMASQIAVALDWLEAGFAAAPYLGGSAPAYADFALHHCLWFMATVAEARAWLGRDYPAVSAWMARLAALGHGTREEIDASAALAMARAAEPAAGAARRPGAPASDPTGLRPGDRVSVTAESFGKESVVGRLTAIDRERITLHRESPDLGLLAVHFPRLGYVVARG